MTAVATTSAKYKKRDALRLRRYDLLETMNQLCPPGSRELWQEELMVAYRKRSIDLRSPQNYDPKFMDEFLRSSYISG